MTDRTEPTFNPEAHGIERSAAGHELTPLTAAEREELAANLTDEERRILLHQGTEPPFCGGLLHTEEDGLFVCRLCGLPLFRSEAKFDSGSGWPSFTRPFDPDHVLHLKDDSHGMVRTEVRCRRCDGHLGHVFPDGPPPSGHRYCINSASLELAPEGEELPRSAHSPARLSSS